MNKNYFKYLICNTYKFSIILLVINFILYGFQGFFEHGYFVLSGFKYITVIYVSEAILVPIYYFIMFLRKRTVDLYYSLPMKRTTLKLTTIIFGYIQLFVCFTIPYLFYAILSCNNELLNINGSNIYFDYFIIMSVLVILIYLQTCVVCSASKSITDLFVLNILWFIGLYLIATIIFINNNRLSNISIIMLVDNISVKFLNMADSNYNYVPYIIENKIIWLYILIHLFETIGLMVYAWFNFKNSKAEEIGSPNKRWETYKLLLALLIGSALYSLYTGMFELSYIYITIIYGICYYFGLCIAYRKITINYYIVISFLALILISGSAAYLNQLLK